MCVEMVETAAMEDLHHTLASHTVWLASVWAQRTLFAESDIITE